MPDQLVAAVPNAILAAADLNTNWDMIEDALLDLGPYVISGLVPSAGAGLAVNVTAGTASIGARVTKSAGFTISGLADGVVNHLYLLRTGSASHNTTGTQPAESVKLGTATTAAGVVTSVDTTPTSGRQTKVDLSLVLVASAANSFTAVQTITLNDASGAAVTRPLILRHSNSGGVGAIGIGAGIDLQIETATEGTFNTAGRVDARASAVTAGAVTGALDFTVPLAGTLVTPLTLTPSTLTMVVDDASGSAVSRPLVLRHTNSGGAGSNGIGTGILFEIETATGGTINAAARIDARTTSATAAAVSAVLDFSVPLAGTMVVPLVLAPGALELADAVNISTGTTTGLKIGTATAQKLGFWNVTPVVQQILATGGGATVDQVIGLLQTLGLCRQA